MKCPNCSNEMINSEGKFSMLQYTLEDGGVAKHDASKFYPVTPHLCLNCGKIELFHAEFIKSEE